jgi:hypothetical protein
MNGKLKVVGYLSTLSKYAQQVVFKFVKDSNGMIFLKDYGMTMVVALYSDEQLIRCITAMHNAEG